MIISRHHFLHSAPFYITFWQLSVYDLRWPNQEYNAAQQRLTQLLEQTLKQTPDPRASSRERNFWNEKKERIEQARANILKDSKEHFAVYAFTRKRLNNEHQHWFNISGWSLDVPSMLVTYPRRPSAISGLHHSALPFPESSVIANGCRLLRSIYQANASPWDTKLFNRPLL